MEWTEEEMMKNLGYDLISDDGVYARYANKSGIVVPDYGIMPAKKRFIYFNRGYKEGVVFVGIREDGDSRTVFNGVCANLNQFLTILNAVR